MSNGKKDNIDDAAENCPLKDRGALFAEVMTYKSGFPKSKKTALQDVDIAISGTTKKPNQKTAANGRTAVFSALVPGNYTVTPQFTDDQKEKYGTEDATSDSKEVKKKKTQSYYFEVPWFWVEHEVKYPDGKRFAKDIQYVLRHKGTKPAAAWTQYQTGITGEQKISHEKVPRGRYRLELKLLYTPTWSADRAVIGTEIELRAGVSGFDVGAPGTFEIHDAHSMGTALHTINGSVSPNGEDKELKTKWTPAKAQLKDLKSGVLVFRATVSGVSVISPPIPAFNKEEYEIEDDTGAKLDTPVELRFSAGTVEKKIAAGGKLDAVYPWNETLIRVSLPNEKGFRVKLDEGGIPTRTFGTPK